MPGQADGSIVIDTEISTEGFKAGSSELLTAIKSLTEKIENLGTTLKELFTAPLTPTIDTSGAEDRVEELETKVHELESALEELKNSGTTTSTGESTAPQVNMGGTAQKASDLQKQIDAVNVSVEHLEPTFQKAMSGSESAMSSFEGKASALKDKIAELQEKLDTVGKTQYPTQAYEELSTEVAKAEQALLRLYDRQDKMKATGVKENSRQWQSLQYDIQNAEAAVNRLEAAKARMEASGAAFTTGVDTTQYAQMAAALSAANMQLQGMVGDAAQLQYEIQQANSAWAQMPTLSGYIKNAFQSVANTIKSAFSTVGTAITHPLQAADRILGSLLRKAGMFVSTIAKFSVNKLVSGIKSAASSMANLLTHSKSTKKQFGGLISGAKKFALSLLGARGVYALLRKAVSAYMAENQQLANTLSSCWSGIGNLLGPIITKLINLVAQAVAYVTSFLKLFGVFSNSAKKAISSAGGTASKEAKELQRQLASFDELNILSDNSSDSSGGGGSGSDAAAALPDATMPDWVKLMVDQLKSGDWSAAATTLADQLNSMIAGVDWAGIGNKIGYYLNGALSFLATFIKTFDWKGLGAKLAEGVNSILNSVDWGNLGTLFSAKFRIILLSLAGFLENLDWGALAKGFGDFAINFFNGITDAISAVDWQKLGQNVATFLGTVDWSGIADAIFRGIGAVLGGLASFLVGLVGDAWDSVVDWWYDVAYEDGSFTIEGLLLGIWEAIKNVGIWIYEHVFQPIWEGIKSAFGISSPSTKMMEIGDYIVQGLLEGISNAWSSIVEFFSMAVSGISEAISNAWSGVKEWTSSTWSKIKETVSGTWDKVKTKTVSVCSTVSSKASKAYSDVKDGISEKMAAAKDAASEAWESMESTASSIGDSIVDKVSASYEDVKSYITEKLSSAKETAKTAWDAIKSTTSTVASSIASTASTQFTKMKDYISDRVNSAKNTATTGWTNMKSAITSAASSMSSSVSSSFSSIYSTVTSKISSCTSTISSKFESARSSIVSKMSSALNTIQNQGWYTVGSNICTGIANGINNGWTWLRNTVSNLASNLLRTAKNALGIRSPSTLFRDEVGKYIGLGIGEGVTDSEPDVLRSVTGVADAIADEFTEKKYTISPISVDSNGAIPRALDSFSGRITDSFTAMLDQLRAIAERVTFTVPAAAMGAVPYSLKSSDMASGTQLGSTIEAANTELGSVVIQSVTNATEAIVRAIQDYSGATVNIDIDSLTQGLIDDINRRTRMTGKNPLLV